MNHLPEHFFTTANRLKKTFIFISALSTFHQSDPVFGTIIKYVKDAKGVTFTLDKGLMNLRVCRSDIIQVRYTILNTFPAFNSLVVNNSFSKNTPFTVKETKEAILINTATLQLQVNRTTNAITYLTAAGQVITSEANTTESKSMQAQTVAGIQTYQISTSFSSPQDEGLYGLGCHPTDTLSINYKGRDQELEIKYMTGAIPVLLSTKGYGLMWDNYASSRFKGTENNNTQYSYTSESGKEVNYYFFYGPGFDQIINLYRITTGTAPMFPKWSFGLFQSQDRYMTQKEILSVKDNYRTNNIPVDVIVQDWYYWDPLPIGSHVMNPERYPDPKSMVAELHKANIHAMISIWPVFGKGTANFDALKRSGGLTSITWDNIVTHTFDTYYDAHNPKARELYWDQARDSLIKRYDWDAWWIDQCEPDNGALLDERRKANFSIGKGINYFNSYSLEHSKGLYKGWRRDMAPKRAFFLIRQSFAGEQRNAATLWSSDIISTFRSLKSQVPQGINACVSGIPYWTSDIGGYRSNTEKAGIPTWKNPALTELFTRWFEFGVFSPIFRIHGKGERALFSSNWSDTTKATLLKYDKLRYRLLPYIYSLAGKVTNENYTIMRSLAFDFRSDPKVYSIPDQYMFGPAFLVNPVTEPMYSGAQSSAVKTRDVYLPGHGQWINFWDATAHQGGETVHADAPLDIIPLFIKAGSIIPMGPVLQYATEHPASAIELRIYPGADGRFTLYEDENDNYNYEKGNSATIGLTWNNSKRLLSLGAVQGTFPGMLRQRTFSIVLVGSNHGTGVASTTRADKEVTYTGKPITVQL